MTSYSLRQRFSSFLLLATLLFACACQQNRQADLLIHNGHIYTMDKQNPKVGMVAVRDGKIIHVGPSSEAAEWQGSAARVIDLAGKTLTPGLIESHGHLLSLGYSKMQLHLTTIKDYDEMIAMVADAAAKSAPGEWILGRGWHQSKWDPPADPVVHGFPIHDALSAVSPDNPVYLRHASGHAAIANAKAMEIAGITDQTASLDGGEIIRDSRGRATGIFIENAMKQISTHVPKSTPAGDRRAMELAVQASLENGITTFRDAGSGADEIAVYKDFLAEGKLDIRLWVMLDGKDSTLLKDWFQRGPEIGLGNDHLTIRAIKLYSDGALGSRGAWLLEQYTDQPGRYGHSVMPVDDICRLSNLSLEHGFQLCVHAIGDRANREVLNCFEHSFKQNRNKSDDARFRIEHAQHLHPDDIPRFSELGVIASMQGIHMASDRPWAILRLGERRIVEGAYVWRKLLDSGAKIVNGTDVPVEPINPIECFYASVTRKTLKGTPEGGYEAEQAMNRVEALRSYTLDGAYGGFEEKTRGSIEVGKYADFTVFSKDILTVAENKILDTVVEMTIVGGEVKFERVVQ